MVGRGKRTTVEPHVVRVDPEAGSPSKERGSTPCQSPPPPEDPVNPRGSTAVMAIYRQRGMVASTSVERSAVSCFPGAAGRLGDDEKLGPAGRESVGKVVYVTTDYSNANPRPGGRSRTVESSHAFDQGCRCVRLTWRSIDGSWKRLPRHLTSRPRTKRTRVSSSGLGRPRRRVGRHIFPHVLGCGSVVASLTSKASAVTCNSSLGIFKKKRINEIQERKEKCKRMWPLNRQCTTHNAGRP